MKTSTVICDHSLISYGYPTHCLLSNGRTMFPNSQYSQALGELLELCIETQTDPLSINQPEHTSRAVPKPGSVQ